MSRFEQGRVSLKAPGDLGTDQLAALCEISQVTVEKEGLSKVTQKVRLHNKLAALDKLVRLLGLLDQSQGDDEAGGLATFLEPEGPGDAEPAL